MHVESHIPIDTPYLEFKKEWLDGSVFRRFEEVCAKHPDRLALKDTRNAFDYREAHRRCLHLAHALRNEHEGKEPVGIALPNNAHFPIAMMAVLANGCPYVPLDLDLPTARNEWIIRHSGAKTLIASREHAIPGFDGRVIYIEDIDFERRIQFKDVSDPSDIAYIIYTSGSTGVPKGVYQNQRNLLHDVMQYTRSIRLSHADRCTLLYSPSVNGAIRDIYGSLLNGASLFIRRMNDNGLHGLSEFIREEGITVYHSIPNIFRTFLGLNPQSTGLASVRIVYLAGDRIFKSDVNLFKRHFGDDALLYVGIGATEVATIYRQWLISKDTPVERDPIPLGYPVPDRDMSIVDEDGKPVRDGETGEITVTSEYVSLGYWNDPRQTSRSFRNAPEGLQGRTYATGDLGRIDSEGMLEFVGRKDSQVKINGHRVETAEVEARMMDFPDVEKCAVDTVETDAGIVLVALFTCRRHVEASDLRNALRQRLPDYMIPRHIVQVDRIPVLHNFKNDKGRIKELILSHLQTDRKGIPGGTGDDGTDPLSHALKSHWMGFLDGGSFDRDLAWRDAGGDSLAALHFLTRLESSTQVRFPTQWFTGAFKPSDVLGFLSCREVPSSNVGRPDETKTTLQPLEEAYKGYAIWKRDGHLKVYSYFMGYNILRRMASLCSWDWSILELSDPQLQRGEKPDLPIERLAPVYADAILKEHVDGPIVLIGNCFTGIDAYATACELQKQTRHPIHVLLFDTRFPQNPDPAAQAPERHAHPNDLSYRLLGNAVKKGIALSHGKDGPAAKALNTAIRAFIKEALTCRLFDPEWYLACYPDVAQAGVDPLAHYLNIGWKEKRHPSLIFNTSLYRSICPDFQPERQNPVLHYLTKGRLDASVRRAVRGLRVPPADSERILASGWFDSGWYARETLTVEYHGRPPLSHYMAIGWRYGRKPHPDFAPEEFARMFPGFEPGKDNPLRHLLSMKAIPPLEGIEGLKKRDEAISGPTDSAASPSSQSEEVDLNQWRQERLRHDPDQVEIVERRVDIRSRYRPPHFKGELHMLSNQIQYDRDPTNGWIDGMHGRIHAIRLHGDHDTYLIDDLKDNAWKVDETIRTILQPRNHSD